MHTDMVKPAPLSVLYGIDYRRLNTAYAQINRVNAACKPPVILPRITLPVEGPWPEYTTAHSSCLSTQEIADICTIQCLEPFKRKARSDFKVARGLSPYPVYVATFADGTVQRLSFWSCKGKEIDFAAGFNVSLVIGRAVPIDGHVEHAGTVHLDPHFTTGVDVQPAKPAKQSPAARLKAICAALNDGDVEAAMLMAKAA